MAAFPHPRDDPEHVRAAASRCRLLAERVVAAAETVTRDANGLTHGWEGPAATACRADLEQARRLGLAVAAPLGRCAPLLLGYLEAVAAARAQIDILRAAHHDGYDGAPAAQPALADHLARHRQILDGLDAAARETGRRLESLVAGPLDVQPSSGRAASLADRARLPTTTPPLLLAQTAAARSRANELLLAELVADLTGDLTADPTRGANRTESEQRWLDNCLAVRRQLELVRRHVDPVTGVPLAAQLVEFDPRAFGGEGRAAVVVGDLDTAEHVAFLVPGLDATVRDSTARLVGDALRITVEARRVAPAGGTATVAWLGYDAPGPWGVGFGHAAEQGADRLARAALTVRAARDVAPHLTLIGHSYGSTTVGTALRDHRTGADDAILLGSPGPSVERASDLRVPPGHVFVGASSRDPVSYLDRFGADPAQAGFGAVRFRAEDPTRNAWRLDGDDHSKYFRPGSESLHNIVRVVVGDYAGVVAAPYRGEWPLLPDGIHTDPESDREPSAGTDRPAAG